MAEHLPSHLQIRADAELGAAWRRCEAALPFKRWHVVIEGDWEDGWEAFATSRLAGEIGIERETAGPTPTAALTALAERLEAAREAESR